MYVHIASHQDFIVHKVYLSELLRLGDDSSGDLIRYACHLLRVLSEQSVSLF